MINNEKPITADAVYYDECLIALKYLLEPFLVNGVPHSNWNRIIQWKGVTTYPSYDIWLEDVNHFRNEIRRLEKEYESKPYYLSKPKYKFYDEFRYLK